MRSGRGFYTDPSGLVRGEALHDAAVLHHSYSEDEHTFYLSILNANEDIIDIFCTNVSCFTIGGFWNGAICGYLFAWEFDEIVDAPEGPWKYPLKILLDSRIQEHTMQRETKKLAELNPGSLLVHFDFVYGGNIVTICSDLSIKKRSQK
jgi:hypothetical protein